MAASCTALYKLRYNNRQGLVSGSRKRSLLVLGEVICVIKKLVKP